jgi:hypothetical protein
MSRASRLARARVPAEARYRADIIVGALMVPESRVIAGLLLRGVDDEAWAEAIVEQNVLKTRRKAIAMRVARLIRDRLETMDMGLVRMVRNGNGTVATHAVMAAAIKHSPLLGDFLALTVGEQYRQFAQSLSNKMWDDYLHGCRERDRTMPPWTEATRRRLRSSVFQTLAQAGYVENTRTLRLQAVHVADQVLHYLQAHSETYVLNCIQVAP